MAPAAELDRLEIQIYASLDGVDRRAGLARERAANRGDLSQVVRADLLRTDVLSRGGRLAEALHRQTAIAQEAMARDDRAIAARAGCYLASTYWRIGQQGESVGAAEQAVAALPGSCPAHWPAEHYMVLALFTSYDRVGDIDFGLFEEALRRARAHGDPLLVLAVLNNYAYTAGQRPDGLALATRLVD